jgi:DNA repair exonuclease SbcCD ATPase subunit
MKNIFNKTILAVMTVALVFAAFPVTSVFAQGENPPTGTPTNDKLEKAWARQQENYQKLGKLFQDSDAQLAKFQERIDKAKANGKDVTAVQSALNAFEVALKKARPIYESMNGIVNSHLGFDASGKVTDATKALSTVQEFHSKMQELKTAMDGTGKALREALKAFRAANKPTATPAAGTGSGF